MIIKRVNVQLAASRFRVRLIDLLLQYIRRQITEVVTERYSKGNWSQNLTKLKKVDGISF